MVWLCRIAKCVAEYKRLRTTDGKGLLIFICFSTHLGFFAYAERNGVNDLVYTSDVVT